jgi:hypothetical protein
VMYCYMDDLANWALRLWRKPAVKLDKTQ